MAKANVNRASRDELVEAGVRAELANEILKLRRNGKITGVDALGQVPGVGPATLERLRQALDFGDKAGNGHAGSSNGNDGRRTQQNGRGADKTAGRTTEGPRSAVRVATATTPNASGAGSRATTNTTRRSLKMVQRAADTTGEIQREAAQPSAEGASELGQELVALVNEQGRQNLDMLAAVVRAVRWDEVIQAQGEFVCASLERITEFNQRYLEMVTRAVMAVPSSVGSDQRDEAA
jgi:hypothetical protein